MLAASIGVTGCFTGERPTVSDDPTAPGVSTSDDAIDTVLEHLDDASSSAFAAEYTLLNKYGNVRSQARVEQDSSVDREISIGSVRFELTARSQSTCNTDTDRCTDRLDDSFVSDLQLTHDFYAESAARKLRRDAMSRTGTSQTSTEEFAGQPATCVVVTVTGGQKRYCALDAGPLALIDGPDVHIELTSFSTDPNGGAASATTSLGSSAGSPPSSSPTSGTVTGSTTSTSVATTAG